MTDTTVAPLHATKVNIAGSGLDYRAVQLTIDDGTASISESSGHSLGSKAGVVTVDRPSAAQYVVTFADGTVWTAVRAGGCGCGGGR